MPPGGGGPPLPPLPLSSSSSNAASLNTQLPAVQPPPSSLVESGSGSGSFLSRISGPHRSSPTASNSFRSDIGEQRSWPEEDWDGTRKRTLSGEWNIILLFVHRRGGMWDMNEGLMMIRNDSFRAGEKLHGRGARRLELRLTATEAATY
jgi:hypothetical protein